MKKTCFLLAMMLLAMSVTASAMTPIQLKINGVILQHNGKSAMVPESMNAQFLKGVYCGSDNDLKDEQVVITQFEYAENNSNMDICIALLTVDDEYYLATYKATGGIIDGALLLKKDDILLGCDFFNPRGNKMRAYSPEILLDKGKVSVKRNFLTYVNAFDKGGPIITEEGSVTKVYEVDNTGKISVSGGGQHSKWTRAANASIPGGKHDRDVTEGDKCRTLGLGMNLISFYTKPVSQENDETINRFEILLKQFSEVLNQVKGYGTADARNCLAALEKCQEGMVLRNPQLWLDWLNKNPESKNMQALQKKMELNNDFKLQLLDAVKSLNNKKLRQAWEKRLK